MHSLTKYLVTICDKQQNSPQVTLVGHIVHPTCQQLTRCTVVTLPVLIGRELDSED